MCDLTRMERRHPPTFTISAAISILKCGGKEQMQMDENNDKMRYTLESEDEMAQPQPMQSPAQPETAEPEAAQTDIDRASIPDKKTRRKIFLLLAAVALVAALGGSALTAAIRAISQMNEAQQAQQAQTTLAEQDVPETEKEPEAAQPETPASAEAELPYRIVSAPLPEELFSNSGDKSLTPGQVYQQNVGCVVGILSKSKTNVFGQSTPLSSSGTGVILSEDGYIVTNYHVVEGADSVKVALHDGQEYHAVVAGGDKMSDVALLKIEAEGLQTAAIAQSGDVAVGEEVVAIGNPLGELTFTMTHGYISATDREINVDGTPINMMQTDAAINSGNSGGPLFDMNGNVIGITAAKYSGQTASGTTIEGIGFAIPIDDALRIVYDLQKYGYVTGRAYLGVTVRDLDADTASDYGLPVGPRVESVVMGSCSEKAGIQSGDIILALGGKNTTSTVGLLAALRDHRAGETVEVDLYRAGAELTVSVTLDERPQNLEVTVEEEPQPETLPDGSGN